MTTTEKKTTTQFSKLKKGAILSETQYYTVDEVKGDKVRLINDNGNPIVVSSEYVEGCLLSADQYIKEELKTRTELAQMFLANPYIAMEVNFNKQVKKENAVKEIMANLGKATIADIENAVKKGVGKALEGEQRTIRGRHAGVQDEFGRVHFVDMEIDRSSHRNRLVDPRTINYLIIKGVKYKAKK